MALETLAGPYPAKCNGSPLTSVGGASNGAWIQGLGLLVEGAESGFNGFYSIELDGTAHRRSKFTFPNLALNLPAGFARGIAHVTLGAIYPVDWQTAQPLLTPIYTRSSGSFGTIHAIVGDRFLQFSGGKVYSSPITDGATFTLEYTWPGSAPSDVICMSAVSDTVVCVCFTSNGQIRFYDTRRKAQTGPTRYLGASCSGAWYVPKHDIFVEAVGTNLIIRADAVRPANLSAPVALSSIAAGYASTIQVVATGAQGEPCVGELIDWSLTAGAGALSAAQTTTDSNGAAQVQYSAPVGSSGSVSISAALDF